MKQSKGIFYSLLDSVHLVATNQGISNDWELDSGALFHVSPNCHWFINYDASRKVESNLRMG